MIKKILALLAVVILSSIVVAACGDDDNDADSGSGPVSGVGPRISVGKALASNLVGPLLVNGFLHVQGSRARLCETLAESSPPQCGGTSLVVEGLDLATVADLTTERSVTWSAQTMQVLGTVEGDILTMSGNVQ